MNPRSLWNRITSSPARSGRKPAALLVSSVVLVAALAVFWNARPTVYLEPADSAGVQPAFIPQAVAVGVPQRPVHTAGQVVSGDALGLYGGTRTEGCDTALIQDFLAAHPDRAHAWAQALLIDMPEISTLLASLTPVTLRTDTAVTNHGFDDGLAEPFQSVLQAGTAVLVDAVGLPRVRCFCGNPLQGPDPQWGAVYGGQRWESFEPESVTVIRRAAQPVPAFVVVKEETDEVVSRPRATSGSNDQEVDPDVRDNVQDGLVGEPGEGPLSSTPASPTTPPSTSATVLDTTPTTAASTSPGATPGPDPLQPAGTSTEAPAPLATTVDPGGDGEPREDPNGDDTGGGQPDGAGDGEGDPGDDDPGNDDPGDGASDGG